jgi:hypothetical protein
MAKRQVGVAVLVVAVITLVGLGFLTQDCSLNNPVPPATTAPPTCTRPAFMGVLMFWLPALVLGLAALVLGRRPAIPRFEMEEWTRDAEANLSEKKLR